MNCPNCHQPVNPGAMFCGNCGYKINANQTVQTAISQPVIIPSVQPPAITPQGEQPINTQPVPSGLSTPQSNYVAQPAATVQQPTIQPADVGTGGVIMGSAAVSPTLSNEKADDSSVHNNSKAIAAFVLGVLGCVGWLIPLVGVILGILALVFGTIALKSQRRVFAIIGMVLAVLVLAMSIFFWVRNAENVLKSKSSPLSGLTDKSTSSALQTITSPCYTTKIPASLTVTQTSDSCTFKALNNKSGETYEVKVLQIAQLSIANLPQAAQTDAENVVNSIPGGSISSQQSSTFSGSPAYAFVLIAKDGSSGALDYVYNTTIQGNLIIIFHAQNSGKGISLSTIENNWVWQ
jgi:uncharacterized membrane protein